MKTSVPLVAVLALAVGAGIGYLSPRFLAEGVPPDTPRAAASAPSDKGGGPQAITVEVRKVARRPFERGITAVGSLRSDESVTLRPEVAGRISQILFKEGQRVQKGQVLIRLDDSVPRAEFEQARANYSLAKSNYDRSIELQQKGFISKQAKDEADNAMKVQEAAMVLAQVRLDKNAIRAPFGGVIGLRNVSVGDYVAVGQDLVALEAIDPLKVDFRIPEIYLPQIRTGQTLEISLDALPDKAFNGTVYAISPLIDTGGRSIVMRAQVKNPGGQLRPGMFARVRLLFDAAAQALAVPEAALVPVGDDQFVYRVREGRAERVQVEVGQRRDALVEITSGLAEGDVVVVAGTQKLRDGVPVKVAATAASTL
ncbi:MAG: efflux RND transporter periplasmic adaptor subunit [Pigmentiphaga sp.]|uniref:efflux RND transporter periplasmic adaptor subunit n=1 Tax=Pigmentiphaga sp. TaxID=1977564 RepID=UPI0029A2B08D|nr:efflux RND transporter periplasmic adaptor subunit [Pigmentiphaga sp.]MDX3904700.1 efflux RND transporter periplasmic adaptor subunit [Pigmentiphaga sp.]